MNQATDNPAATETMPDPLSPRRSLAIAGCVLAICVFVGAVVILYACWARNSEPSCLLTIVGDDSIINAVVTVESPTKAISWPIVKRIRDGENNRLRFHLPPGTYEVTVRDPEHGQLYPRPYEGKDLILQVDQNILIAPRGLPTTLPTWKTVKDD